MYWEILSTGLSPKNHNDHLKSLPKSRIPRWKTEVFGIFYVLCFTIAPSKTNYTFLRSNLDKYEFRYGLIWLIKTPAILLHTDSKPHTKPGCKKEECTCDIYCFRVKFHTKRENIKTNEQLKAPPSTRCSMIRSLLPRTMQISYWNAH